MEKLDAVCSQSSDEFFFFLRYGKTFRLDWTNIVSLQRMQVYQKEMEEINSRVKQNEMIARQKGTGSHHDIKADPSQLESKA